ncbi:MAG: carboxymuconolactone decarboxylase family protein, partial [Pseudonocardiaceae bacterium]
MSALRLIGATEAPLLARRYYSGGDPGPLVAALAHVPEVLEVAMPFLGTILGPSSIPMRTKEIVILRTSALAGCSYCVAAHTAVALDTGLGREEIVALRCAASVADAFTSPADVALLAWVDAVAGPGPIPAAVAERFQL